MVTQFGSIGKLAAHVGNGISIWLVAVVINKDLNKRSNKLATAPLLADPTFFLPNQ
jgi:hypothetical protein